MTPLAKYSTLFVLSVILMVWVIVKTSRSSFSKDRKVAVYIIAVLAPIIGFILYLVFRKQYLSGKI